MLGEQVQSTILNCIKLKKSCFKCLPTAAVTGRSPNNALERGYCFFTTNTWKLPGTVEGRACPFSSGLKLAVGR
jgi:hypothetical protein